MKNQLLYIVLFCISNLYAQNTTINIEPTTTLSINGISVLDRSKYFNFCHSGVNFESSINNSKLTNKYIGDLDISFGRTIGMVAGAVKYTSYVKEDTARPGICEYILFARCCKTYKWRCPKCLVYVEISE